MSYNDSYGDEPRRAGRRAAYEPSGPAKVQGSTAAAILVLLAIVGFGVGALIGNSGGDEPGSTAVADDEAGASLGPPDDQGTDPDASESEDPDENGDAEVAVTLEMADSAPAGEELEYTVSTDPPQPGLVLGVERRQPGGDWEPFGRAQVEAELGDDGTDSGHVITGRTGESEWRVVGELNGERVESNVVTAEITEEEDNSGPGNGNDNENGNGNGDDNGDD